MKESAAHQRLRERADRLSAVFSPPPVPTVGSDVDRIRQRLERVLGLEAIVDARFFALQFSEAASLRRDLAAEREMLANELEDIGDRLGAGIERAMAALDGWHVGRPDLTLLELQRPDRKAGGRPLASYSKEFLLWSLCGRPSSPEIWVSAFEQVESERRWQQKRESEVRGFQDGRQRPVEVDLEAAVARFWLGDLEEARCLAASALDGARGWPASFMVGQHSRVDVLARAQGLCDLLAPNRDPRRLSDAESRLVQSLARAPENGSDADRTDLVLMIVIARLWRHDPQGEYFGLAFPGLRDLSGHGSETSGRML